MYDLLLSLPYNIYASCADGLCDSIAVHALTDVCWKKCITGPIRSGKLDKGEETCAQNCVGRFLDANFTVIKHLEKMRSQQ